MLLLNGLVTELAYVSALEAEFCGFKSLLGYYYGELPLIGKGVVLKTTVGNHLGVQVSHSPLYIGSRAVLRTL